MLAFVHTYWLQICGAIYVAALVLQTLPIPASVKSWCARVSFAIDRVERDQVIAAQIANLTATNSALLAKIEALTAIVVAIANDSKQPPEPTTPAIKAAQPVTEQSK